MWIKFCIAECAFVKSSVCTVTCARESKLRILCERIARVCSTACAVMSALEVANGIIFDQIKARVNDHTSSSTENDK